MLIMLVIVIASIYEVLCTLNIHCGVISSEVELLLNSGIKLLWDQLFYSHTGLSCI